jgi:hypothetical protein
MRKRLLGSAIAGVIAVATLAAGPASAADATLNVVHGIPGVDVDVCLNGTEAISDFNPGEVVSGVALPAGSYDVKIVAKGDDCSDAAVLEADDVALAAGRNYTAIAHLTAGGDPTLGLFVNKVKPVRRGTARLQVRHTAAAPEVDVWANGARLVTGLVNGDTATAAVPKGIYAAWASMPGEIQPVIGPAVLRLRGGHAYQVYAWGSGSAVYRLAVVDVAVGTR